MNRRDTIHALGHAPHIDVVIIGAGVNGACLYDVLCRAGYRVLLVDKGDFASGTSQASGMMVWGGLLYLRNLDLRTVVSLSADRDHIIAAKPGWLAPATMRYLPAVGYGRPKAWMQFGLWLYWLLGCGRRRAPTSTRQFSEQALLQLGTVNGALTYEEAFLADSDARFAFRWIASPRRAGQYALNYCESSGGYNRAGRRWYLKLRDSIDGVELDVDSAMVVNCAGVWTDEVNAAFGIETPFRHVFSKGVYLTLPRQSGHDSSLFFELGKHNDIITHVPWGPVALWGPTETAVNSIADGFAASREDIDFLLEQYARRYRIPMTRSDIVSLRCGIRPLVVPRNYRSTVYPLDLSRRQEVVRDRLLPWISCYGGKLTGCSRMASLAMAQVDRTLRPSGHRPTASLPDGEPAGCRMPHYARFPGLAEVVVAPAWSAQNEMCVTLEDYLRRRTNIAQWIPRGGLGVGDCHALQLQAIALELTRGNNAVAQRMFLAYQTKVARDLDPLLTDNITSPNS